MIVGLLRDRAPADSMARNEDPSADPLENHHVRERNVRAV